ADLHRVLGQVRYPAIAQTLAVRTDAAGTIAVRTPVEDATLDAIAGPLDSATVAWIGATLMPAVLAAGPATRGALRAADVGLDAAGHPILAPLIEPVERLSVDATRSVAPESFDGRAPDGAAGLYGLGVLLYRLATGQSPASSGGSRGARIPPPPPSAVRHGIPPELDAAILRLLSADPGQRPGALPVLQDLAGPPVDLRARGAGPPQIRAGTDALATSGGAVRTTRTSRDDDDPGGLVLIPADELARLDPSARSYAAGVANLPLQVVDGLAEQRLPLVLATTAGRAAAAERATALARSTGLPIRPATPSAIPGWLVLAVASGAAAIPAVVGLVFLAIGWLPVAIVAWVVAALAVLAGALGARRRGRIRSDHAAGTAALARIREGRSAREGDGLLGPAWDRLARIRIEVARADLPLAASADLRGALKELEARLEALAQVGETARRTLRQVDLSALRTRLATLVAKPDDAGPAGTARRAERDRLARTVADLEAVEARSAAVGPEAHRIVDALGEIGAVLAQLGGDDEAGMSRVDRAARKAREAATPAPSDRVELPTAAGPDLGTDPGTGLATGLEHDIALPRADHAGEQLAERVSTERTSAERTSAETVPAAPRPIPPRVTEG
ncbi:MAG: hypothetical protein ABMB14_19215, partial [Myxococcota bacterium]